jgi:exosortase/archaeosortase family protein
MNRSAAFRAAVAGIIGAAVGGLLVRVFPALELGLFANGAARLAGFFTGSPVVRVEQGWALPAASSPVVVTAACSATSFFVMVTAIIAWQLARRGRSVAYSAFVALGAALPVAIFINSLRIVTVAQAHRWVIPLFPDTCGPFLHLATGVAVFLPSLIALNLILDPHGYCYTHPNR